MIGTLEICRTLLQNSNPEPSGKDTSKPVNHICHLPKACWPPEWSGRHPTQIPAYEMRTSSHSPDSNHLQEVVFYSCLNSFPGNIMPVPYFYRLHCNASVGRIQETEPFGPYHLCCMLLLFLKILLTKASHFLHAGINKNCYGKNILLSMTLYGRGANDFAETFCRKKSFVGTMCGGTGCRADRRDILVAEQSWCGRKLLPQERKL